MEQVDGEDPLESLWSIGVVTRHMHAHVQDTGNVINAIVSVYIAYCLRTAHSTDIHQHTEQQRSDRLITRVDL